MFRKMPYILQKKIIQKEKNKKIIHLDQESCTASLGKITQTHTPITHIHRSSYRTTPTKTDTCIHIVHGCLTKLFVEKHKNQKNKSLRHISANLLVT